jgi:hypothetical protein
LGARVENIGDICADLLFCADLRPDCDDLRASGADFSPVFADLRLWGADLNSVCADLNRFGMPLNCVQGSGWNILL